MHNDEKNALEFVAKSRQKYYDCIGESNSIGILDALKNAIRYVMEGMNSNGLSCV